jgi:hypothetical protein
VGAAGAVDSSEFTVALTRPSARGRHRHLLRRNIVGPVTVHGGQERGSGNGDGDGGDCHDGSAMLEMEDGRALLWGDAFKGTRCHIRALA